MENYKAKFISGDPNDGTKDFQITFELYRDGVLLHKYVDAFIGSGFIPAYSYNESKKEIYIKAEDYFYDSFGAWGREGTKYNLPTNDISKYEKINIEGYVFPEKPANPPDAPPTGDIKAFIDNFNKDFDLKLKSLLDDQQNYKNVYADAIKITTPKEGPWPNDPKVVTIGDLFKYTFPDIESDTLIAPTMYNTSDYENYNGFSRDLPKSKDEKISKMYHTISNGIRSNKSINNYQNLKKPGITNPNLWSPGQYYFDVFMSRMLSPYGPLKDPSDANGGENAFGGNIIEGGGFLNGWLKSHGGSASVSNFNPTDNITEESTTFGYSIFSEILDGGYDGSGIKYVMDAKTGIAIGLGDPSPTPPNSYINLKTQYKTGLLSDFISVENGKIIRKDPTFDISRGDVRNASDKYVDIGQIKLLDITGYKFVGNYEHILLYKAFVQAGDNYKSVVLPRENPEEPKPEPVTVLSKPVESTAIGEVQFKFNVEKTDTFIVVGGTVSPPLEFIIVPNDGTEYIIDTPDVFDTVEGLDEEYKETGYGETEEEIIALQAFYGLASGTDGLDLPESVKKKAKESEKVYNNNSNDNVTSAQLKNASSTQDFWTLVAICSREDGDPQAWCDVAQSIYNRVGSGSYGGKNITSIVTATWQYEPCWSFPRRSGTNGQVNTEWKKILDINSASVASGQPISRLKEVAAALKNKTLQQNSKNFIGGRTDFFGVGQAAKAMTDNGSKIQRTSKNNQFGYSFNYKATVCYSIPNIVDTISVA
jgi:hypothetical protein